jgi:hypothetical protein
MAEPQTTRPAIDPTVNLYEVDFHAWTREQAELLRARQWERLDLENLAEEIESLGRQQRQELRNRLSILLAHLLKWHYQSSLRSRSWSATIRVQRMDIAELLEDNPGLQPYLEEALGKAYRKGVELAISETGLPRRLFPADCPYTLAEILNDRFYPGEDGDQ